MVQWIRICLPIRGTWVWSQVWEGARMLWSNLALVPQLLSLCSRACKPPQLISRAANTSRHSCMTLCDPIDSSPPGSSIPGIPQARILEWVAISFSNAWKWKVKVKSLSRVWLFKTPWTVAYQTLLSMGFSRQVYWSGLLWLSLHQ